MADKKPKIHELKCPHCDEEVSGPDLKSVKATMARHAVIHAKPAAAPPPVVEEEEVVEEAVEEEPAEETPRWGEQEPAEETPRWGESYGSRSSH